MNILVYHSMKFEDYPPVKSLVDILIHNGHYVTLITKYTNKPHCECDNKLRVLGLYNNENDSFIRKTIGYLNKLHFLRRLVTSEMKNNDVLWTTTDNALRELGDVVLKYKHVMQLMELVDDIPLFPIGSWPRYNIARYARKAYKVVVPEYNRAQILKAWWNLDVLPTVLPNKPSKLPTIENAPCDVINQIEKLKNEKRKIILYQGPIQSDRNIEIYAETIEKMSAQYVLYIMGKDNAERKSICDRFKNIEYIPFIPPPYHLLITKLAYIGILPYTPRKVGYNSILNAVFCAPNKIFEFTAFGIPMIGSDLPGVRIPFEIYKIGKYICDDNLNSIKDSIEQIDTNYEEFSKCCRDYYESIDLNAILNSLM